MRRVETDRIATISDYRLVTSEIPRPGAGEVLIRVKAVGMGYVDALVAVGGYQVKPSTPFTPGQELSGVIEAVGREVAGVQPGDRVMAGTFGGGLAEYVVVDQASVLAIPPAMRFAQAASFRTNYLTALHALRDRARLASGERLLVLGAAGGVGTATVQVGRLMGADVVAAASTEDKRGFAIAQGARAAIDTEPEGWRERVKSAFDGRGPDVVLDPVSGPLFEPSFRSIAWKGRYLVVGFAGSGGEIARLAVNLPLLKGGALLGVDVRQFMLYEADRAAEHLAFLLDQVAAGNLVPPVGRTFAFDDFAEAMAFGLSGQGLGKPVIEVAGDDASSA